MQKRSAHCRGKHTDDASPLWDGESLLSDGAATLRASHTHQRAKNQSCGKTLEAKWLSAKPSVRERKGVEHTPTPSLKHVIHTIGKGESATAAPAGGIT